jgi:demethylmenaquinone methyltransferase/2-methoxy-6-polyprenyl-1,4-benzoquinol methylase
MQTQLLTWQISIERIKPTTAELAATYDKLAHLWDGKLQRLGYDRAYQALFTDLYPTLFAGARPQVNGAEREEAIPVLDCGLGTGALTLALHRIAPLPLHLHGVDVAPRMVAEAQRRLTAAGAAIHARTHDISALPYADASFNLVMSAHTLEHLPDATPALHEMVRVLKPGGVLLLLTTRRGLFGSLLNAQWGLHLCEPTAVTAWLQNTGMVDIRTHSLGGPPWCRWMSDAYTARKMLTTAQSEEK